MTRLLIVFASANLAVSVSAAPPAEPPATVKIALLKSMVRDVSPQKVDAMAANFKSVIREQSGFEGELVIAPTLDDLHKQMVSGEVKLGAFHGFEFAWVKQKQPDLEPFMLAVGDPDALKSVVVVHKDCPAKSIVDIRGSKLNLPVTTPEHSRLFLDRLFAKRGVSIKDSFQNVESPKTIEDALDEVVDGKAQAAVIERTGLKMFERRKPGRFAKLKMLEESPAFPPSVLAYIRGKVGDSTLKQFREGMSKTDQTEKGKHLMTQMKIKKFDTIPADYEKQLEAISKEYPALK